MSFLRTHFFCRWGGSLHPPANHVARVQPTPQKTAVHRGAGGHGGGVGVGWGQKQAAILKVHR